VHKSLEVKEYTVKVNRCPGFHPEVVGSTPGSATCPFRVLFCDSLHIYLYISKQAISRICPHPHFWFCEGLYICLYISKQAILRTCALRRR